MGFNDTATPKEEDAIRIPYDTLLIVLCCVIGLLVVGVVLFCLRRRLCPSNRGRSHSDSHVTHSCSCSHSGPAEASGQPNGYHGDVGHDACARDGETETQMVVLPPPPSCSEFPGGQPGQGQPQRHLQGERSGEITPRSIRRLPRTSGEDVRVDASPGSGQELSPPGEVSRQQLSPLMTGERGGEGVNDLGGSASAPEGRPLNLPPLASVCSTRRGRDLSSGSDENQPIAIDNPEQPRGELFRVTERSVKITVAEKVMVAITHEVGPKGDHLILDDVGISLVIPPGAVASGKHLITLILDWDSSDSPSLASNEGHISPVVCCYPHGFQFQKICLLRFKHCAFDPRQAKVLVSETDLTDRKEWLPFGNSPQELETSEQQNNRIELPNLTSDEVQIPLRHLSLYTCVQYPPEDGGACRKWLQVAAFAAPLQMAVDHYQVRIYFLNKTPCALQWAIHNEAAFGHVLACPEKVILCEGGGQDMCVRLTYLSSGWEVVGEGADGEGEVRVKFVAVWHNKCPYADVYLRRLHGNGRRDSHAAARSRLPKRATELSFQLALFQETMDNQAERLVVHITQSQPEVSEHAGNSWLTLGTLLQTAQYRELEAIVRSQESHVIPYPLKVRLCTLLDPPSPFGHDWKELASLLGLDSCIHYLEFKAATCSPTIILLSYMEEKGMTLTELRSYLERMGRRDALLCLQSMADDTEFRDSEIA